VELVEEFNLPARDAGGDEGERVAAAAAGTGAA